jgi:hypothetical protein
MENFYINPIKSSESSSKIPTNIELPIINMDNAILYLNRDNSDYYNSFNLYPIHSGLVLHNSQYYYFYHDIINTPTQYGKNRSGNICFSYNIYLLKDDYAKELINIKTTNYWEIILHSFFYFSKSYLSIGFGKQITNYIYESNIVGDTLIIPYGKTPASLRSKTLIKDFLKPKSINSIEINRTLYREMILSEVLE